MTAKKAGNRGKGRPKGTPNKATKAVKDALIEAFDKLGGVPSLVKFGRKNPAAFYTLWAKMLPQEVKAEHTGKDGEPLTLTEVVVRTREEARIFLGMTDVGGANVPPVPETN